MSFVTKSSLPKDYIPDYVIFLYGFPVLVIEAKSPDTSARLAISEARLYAQALNESFPSGTNPVSMVSGCNGRELSVGSWDSIKHSKFSCAGLLLGSDLLSQVRDLIGVDALTRHARRIQRTLTRSSYSKPARQLDSQLFIERIRPNVLAPYLNPLYEMFFRAEDPEKIQLILARAYVDTGGASRIRSRPTCNVAPDRTYSCSIPNNSDRSPTRIYVDARTYAVPERYWVSRSYSSNHRSSRVRKVTLHSSIFLASNTASIERACGMVRH